MLFVYDTHMIYINNILLDLYMRLGDIANVHIKIDRVGLAIKWLACPPNVGSRPDRGRHKTVTNRLPA